MKAEILFDETDLRVGAKKAHGGTQSQLHIPRACYGCDGRSWGGSDCLGIDCPCYNFMFFGVERRRNA